MRAVILLSGGLDSTLAAYMVRDQGIETVCLHFTSLFCTCSAGCRENSFAQGTARKLGIELKTIFLGQEYLDLIADPPHGRGRHMNPCIDCRIHKFRLAAELIKDEKDGFVVTGEVVGQRPMSQTLSKLRLIEKESGLEGRIVRPLSAHLLEPTLPEKKGLLDRGRMMGISGRSRRRQMALAEEKGLGEGEDYSCPAGGCRLTTSDYSKKLSDLLRYRRRLLMDDVRLLSAGRHFRISENVKIAVGRDEKDNLLLERIRPGDSILMSPACITGPSCVITGTPSQKDIKIAAGICGRYAGRAGEEVAFVYTGPHGKGTVNAVPLSPENTEKYRIN